MPTSGLSGCWAGAGEGQTDSTVPLILISTFTSSHRWGSHHKVMDAVEPWAAGLCNTVGCTSNSLLLFGWWCRWWAQHLSQQLELNPVKRAESITELWVQIYASQSAFKQRSWHEEHPLAGFWLAAAWQDLISYVHEIWPNLHLLTLAPRLATCQMNVGSQVHHYLFKKEHPMYKK